MAPTRSHSGHGGSYIIVGAGIFGASAALQLISENPSATVTLIDRTPFLVIRADYTKLIDMELALEALELWRSDPMYNAFYHESGLIWLDNAGVPQTIIKNYKTLKACAKYSLIDIEEARINWDGIHSDANYDTVLNILWNESGGWAEASNALKFVIETAVEKGVKYVEANIESVVFDKDGSTTGVQTAEGPILNSAPLRKEIHVGDRIKAAAIFTGMATLSDDDAAYFRKGPVFIHDIGASLGGSIPPNAANQLKFWRDVSFMNTVHHEVSGENISMPPDQADYAQWEVTPGMKRELQAVCKGAFGDKAKNWDLHKFRICWESKTLDGDQVISGHPHSKGLYVVAGGSFHSWKFLPNIGKYVVQMLHGSLDPKLALRSWDRDSDTSEPDFMWPQREMKDV
ncbi:sarcosine oxidase [Cadophora sp. DSE1049]|nr:sarcosine oxidase [Cadophora sp. DSE1049]